MNKSLLFLSLLVTACAAVPESTAGDSAGLSFIHVNDTYRVGAVEDGNRGGFARVVTVIRNAQDEGRDVRVLHGGDFLYPSLESQFWHGEQMIEAMNYIDSLAPMYVVAGNHEFDHRTPDHLVDAVHASQFDWLGDNYRFATRDAAADAALNQAFTVSYDDRTIGIFSLTLHGDDDGGDRPYVLIDRDYVGIAENVIEKFEARGVNLIIGLTHLHLWIDAEIARLREEHPTFGFVVGAHEHEPQYSATTESSAAIMKGASNARVIWRIDVDFDAVGQPIVNSRRIDLDETVAEDADYTLIDDKWRGKLLELYPLLEAIVGYAAIPMDVREDTVRNQEVSWGNFVVDQMRGAFGKPDADLAFINSGSLRIDDFIADDIRFEDIARTFGFSSYLRHLTISGAEFRELMEAGFRGAEPSQGYFPQVSGFRLCIDRSLSDGKRIVSLQLPADGVWREIDAAEEYTLVIPDFLFQGNDGYEVPERRKASASRPGSELKYLVLDAVLRAQAEGRAVGVAVDPANPRIVELDSGRQDCWQ